jgi:hypothetical protein
MTESKSRMKDADRAIEEGRNLRRLNKIHEVHTRMAELIQLIMENYDTVTKLSRKLNSMSSNAYDMMDITKRKRDKATVILKDSIEEYNQLVLANKFTIVKDLMPNQPYPGSMS